MIKLDKNLDGSNSVKFTNVQESTAPSKLFQKGYTFPVGKLTKVEAVNYKKEINGEEVEKVRLEFTFTEVGEGKKGRLIHSEFEQDPEGEYYEQNLDNLLRRIKHIREVVIDQEMEESLEAASFAELFQKVAEEFNSHTAEIAGKTRKLYTKKVLYIKVVYGRGNSANRQGLPNFPNFVQEAKNAKGDFVECLLDVSTKENIKPKESGSTGGAMPSGTNNTFGGGSEDDFPDDL